MTDEQAEQVLKELEFIRKLMILDLFEKGYSQSQLAQVLGVSQPTISRMVPNIAKNKKAAHDK
jgi:predicted transcriptional regulator